MNIVLVEVFTDMVIACLGVVTILWTVKTALSLGNEIGGYIKALKKA